jgi:tellurite resistance protein
MTMQEMKLDESVEFNRLKNFPIMMFAIVMGLSGLTIVFQKAEQYFGFGGTVGSVLAVVDTVIFLTILVTYGIKVISYTEAVKNEFAHPVRINFFAASAISFLLIAIVFHPINPTVPALLFWIGTTMQTFFTFYTISYWINHNLELDHSNPAWFIPVVGNVLVPVAGAGLAPNEFLIYYFSIGLFFWIVLTAILINRIIFHHQLANKFIPTMFIFIAPPAVAFIAYVKMFGAVDTFALMLYNLGLFFSFLLFFMYRNFMGLKFFISWWAFTFPLAAITIASMLIYHKTAIAVYSYFSYLFMTMTTLVVIIVAYKTIQNMRHKEICIQE